LGNSHNIGVGEITLKVDGGGGRAEEKFILAAVMAKKFYYLSFDSQSGMLLVGSLKIVPTVYVIQKFI
jgi:hypothetical protein